MKALSRLLPILPVLPVLLAGCQPPGARQEKARASIQKNLGLLSSEDRKLAEEQGFCAVETENQLGSMGKPYKVMVKGQPVFLCCEGCKKAALKDPDATLARVEKLRASAARQEKARSRAEVNIAKLEPRDRKLAEEQGFCAVETENRLGSMGKPYKVMVKSQPVFLCCEGCKKAALKDPDATLARVEKLRAQTRAEKAK